MQLREIFLLTILLLCNNFLNAQAIDSLNENPPRFIMYGDNYFISGIPLDKKITPSTSDVKFRFGFAHKIFNTPLLWGFSLYLTYQQKAFWDVYKESSPFREVNYNPGVAFGKIITTNNFPLGIIFVELEHESNGRDGIYTRSWNRVSFNSAWYIYKSFLLNFNFWIPFAIDKDMNKDILDFYGYYNISINYHFNKNIRATLSGHISDINDIKGNFTLGFLVNTSQKFNRYYYLQLFHGYGENLLEYNQKRTMLRFGISFPGDFLDIIGLK
ncbi:MAG: phospholipase [Ignavibacteriae bacterium]|nr:MAG: phospholipase [Ignavibacteriota bacterium]